MKNLSVRISMFWIFCLAANMLMGQSKKQASLIGKINIQSYLESAPGFPMTIGEAANRTYGGDLLQGNTQSLEDFYQPFYKEVESLKKQYNEVYGNKMQQFANQKGEAGMRRMAEEEANKSVMVQKMGGVNNIAQMDKKEAEAKAKQAAIEYGSEVSGGMFTPEQMQRMMTDKEYAKQMQAKLSNMSQKEKEAMVMQRASAMQSQPKTPQQMQEEHKQFEKRMDEKNEVMNSMEFQQYITSLQKKIQALIDDYSKKQQAVKGSKGNHQELSAKYSKEFEAIPERSYGEAGRHKDADMWLALDVKYTKLHRERAEAEMREMSGLVEKLRSGYKMIVAEYTDYIQKNKSKINDSMDDLIKGTNTEIMLAGFESSLVGLSEDIADITKNDTKEAAGYYRQEWMVKNKK